MQAVTSVNDTYASRSPHVTQHWAKHTCCPILMPLFEEDKDFYSHLIDKEMEAWEELINSPMFQSIRNQSADSHTLTVRGLPVARETLST